VAHLFFIMKQTGMITWSDVAGLNLDTYYQVVSSQAMLAAFVSQIQPLTHSSLNYYAITQGYVIDSVQSATTGDFDTVSQYLKIFMYDVDTQEPFYHFLPAPVSTILENQRNGKRIMQDIGELYAGYVSTMRGHAIEFKHAYLVGYKY